MKKYLVSVILCLATLLLVACSSSPSGVRVVNGGTSAIPDKAGVPIHNLSGPEIGLTLGNKTFQYTRSNGSGFVTYKADGTFTYQDDQKGQGTGKWTATGDQYCESYGTAPQECGVFKYTGDAYFAANSRLVEMKI